MKPWTEENFLERLMPQLRQEGRNRMKSCPDAELLTAFAEGGVDSSVQEAVTAHLTQCRQCRDICIRLVNFDKGTVPLQDAEWGNAEKRLNNWMDGFQLSRSIDASKGEVVRGPNLKNTSKVVFWWKLPWVMAAAVVVVVVLGGIFAGKRAWIPSEVAKRRVMSHFANPVPGLAHQVPPESERDTKKILTPTTKVVLGTNTNRTARKKSTSVQSTPANSNGSNQIAQGVAPRELKPNEPMVAGGKARSMTLSKPATGVRNRIGGSFQAGPGGGAAGAHSGSARFYFFNANPHRLPPHNSSPVPPPHRLLPRNPSPEPPPLPAQLRFEAGTRLWISVFSVTRQPDGSFNFGGTLLQPVSLAGGDLEKDTVLSGSASTKDGEVTILIRRFLIRGASYELQGGAAETSKEQMPGTGKALEFDNGKIEEMWFSSATVYGTAATGGSADSAKP